MKKQDNHSFAVLFKKYRLRSEIETLSQFGDLLAQEGLIYETSLFSRWQKGQRIPKERKILLKTIALFVKHGGIKASEEADSLLAAAFMRDLDDDEITIVGLDSQTDLISREVPYCDLSYTQSIKLMLTSIVKSRYFYLIAFIFIVTAIWDIRIWTLRLFNTPEANYVGLIDGLIPLSSGFYIYYYFKHKKNILRFNRVVTLLSLGLLSQWTGLIIWSYYTLLLNIQAPYPSIADLGYFGIIPFYILAAYEFPTIESKDTKTPRFNKRLGFFLVPVLLLAISYSMFLQSTGINYTRQVTILLNAFYPLGDITPMLIVIYKLTSYKYKLSKIVKIQCIFLLFAFTIQFIADYGFIYAVQIGAFANGGVTDYLYKTSYMIMCIVLIPFTDYQLYNHIMMHVMLKKISLNKNKTLLSILPHVLYNGNKK